MKLIITGATGFIGRNFAEYFHKTGHKILAMGRSQFIGKQISSFGIEFREADITNRCELNQVFEKADCIIHCAGKAGDWGKYKAFYHANVNGTKNIIENCKKYGIKRIIFISTPSVYYSGTDRFNIKERDSLPAKQFSYGKTKLIAENKLQAASNEGINTIIFRPRAVYGKYDNIIVPRILKLSEKKKFPLINNGNAQVDLTYIDNLTYAVELGLRSKDNVWNQTYNISNGNPITIKDWFRQVLEIFSQNFNPKNIPESTAMRAAMLNELMCKIYLGNLTPTLTKFSVGYMAKSLTMSIDKAKQNLGYLPKFNNIQGFELYKEWYQTFKSK